MISLALEMIDISKRFPGVVALNNVNLTLRAGEILALMGENGAGKSTLMKILGGVYQPDTGIIKVNGQAVKINSVNDATSLGIGFIHQELNVLDNLDIAGNVFLGREPVWAGPLRLINRSQIYEQTNTYTKRLGLDLPSNTPLADLSIAQKQLVEIAKALSLNASILIMDEPTSSLTLKETETLLNVVKDLRSHGVSIIYISHRLGEVEEIADRAVVLRDGNNAGSLEREAINHDNIVKLMVGRDIKTFYVHSNAEKEENYFEVKNLRTQRYPNCSVSFNVSKGEILGFAGLVGAGRSETAQAIFGVEDALEGDIVLDDKPIRIHSASDAIKNGIYLIPEDRRKSGIIVDMPIRENITLPNLPSCSSAGLITKDAERKLAMDQCQKLNVKAPNVEEKVGNLSGGNQQKVVLAKWLAMNPKLLIFDEPTRGIDVGAKAEIYSLMRQLAENGVAIIMISSDMEEILGISDRVVVMHEGSITGVLNRDQLSEEAIMNLAVGRNLALEQ
jgi:ribose transport system ATP-binding protein